MGEAARRLARIMDASSSAGGQGAVCKPVAGVELGLVTDKFWAVLVERHRLALEIGYDQQVRQIFRARRLLVDGTAADQLGGEIDGTN